MDFISHEGLTCIDRHSLPAPLFCIILTICWQPPHRLSGFNSYPINSSPRNSSQGIVATEPHTPDANARGAYSQPLAAAAAVSAADEPFMAPSGPNFYEYGGSQDHRWLEKQEAAKKRSKWIVGI